MEEFYINSDGIKLHSKLDRPEGITSGPLCFLVHGFTGHMEEPHILAARDGLLRAGVAVLRVEMYGHGGSDGKFSDHTLYKWVTNALDVVKYARTLDSVTDLYMCGHSQGGMLTILIGGMCADDIKTIIPMSPAWMIPDDAKRGSILGNEFDPDHIPDKLVSADWELGGDYIRVAQTIHVEDEIARFRGPVALIHGDMDDVAPYSYAEKAAGMYSNAKLIPIHGADHCFNGFINELEEAVYSYASSVS